MKWVMKFKLEFLKIYRVQHSICPAYIKVLSHEKHLFYKRIKIFKLRSDLSNLQVFCDLSKEYRVLSDYIISVKKNIRIIKFINLIHSIYESFLKNGAHRGWFGLKKISKPSYPPSKSFVYIKDKAGNVLVSQEDLLDCNNYHGISFINIGLKILSKLKLKELRIMLFLMELLDQNSLVLEIKINKIYISLFVSICEIHQKRKFNDQFIFLAPFDFKKASDLIPIYKILTKLNNTGIRCICLQFVINLYLTLKAHANFNSKLSKEFPIHRGVRQGYPLSPILFNLFINCIFEKCKRYGVITERKECCSDLFVDDIVLLTPSKSSLKNLLEKAHNWSIKNKMTFGISK